MELFIVNYWIVIPGPEDVIFACSTGKHRRRRAQATLFYEFYVLYVPKHILSVLQYRGVGDFNKREMRLTLIFTFKFQVFDGTKKYSFLRVQTVYILGHTVHMMS